MTAAAAKAATGTAAGSAVEIAIEFGFDAAHCFRHADADDAYKRMHGHSFTAQVAVRGIPDAQSGFVVDFARLEQATGALHRQLDHVLLNEVPGLAVPSLENIAVWIWDRLAPQFPGLCRVVVARPSCRQTCTYSGPAGGGTDVGGAEDVGGASGAETAGSSGGVRPQNAAMASK